MKLYIFVQFLHASNTEGKNRTRRVAKQKIQVITCRNSQQHRFPPHAVFVLLIACDGFV